MMAEAVGLNAHVSHCSMALLPIVLLPMVFFDRMLGHALQSNGGTEVICRDSVRWLQRWRDVGWRIWASRWRGSANAPKTPAGSTSLHCASCLMACSIPPHTEQ